jgi:hypothetical protein
MSQCTVQNVSRETQYIDWLQAGRSGDRIPVEARFSAPVQNGPGAHPASCTMRTVSSPAVKSGPGVTLTSDTPPPPSLVSWSRKSRAIPLLYLWAVRVSVQGRTLSFTVQKTYKLSRAVINKEPKVRHKSRLLSSRYFLYTVYRNNYSCYLRQIIL